MSLRAQARKRVLILVGCVVLIGGSVGSYYTLVAIRTAHRFAGYRETGLAEAAPAGPGDEAPAALDAATAKRYHDAADKLKAYLRRTPDDPAVWAALVHTMEQTDTTGEQSDSIREALRQLLHLAPDRNDDRRELMKMYYARDLMTEANSTADELLKKVPNDPDALRVKTNALMQLHRYPEALAAAEKRISMAPDDWVAQFDRLQCLSNTGHKADEIAAIAAGLVKRDPGAQGAWITQAYAYELNESFPEEAAALKTAATRPSSDFDLVTTLVRSLDSGHMHAEAMTALKNSLPLNNKVLRQYYLHRLWEDGRFAEAAELAEGPAAASFTDSECQGMICDSLRRAGKETESAAVLAELKSRKDDKVAAAWVAIEIAQTSGGREAALALRTACTAAAEKMPRNPYLAYFQGAADSVLGETPSAIDHWNRASVSATWALPLIQIAKAQLSLGHSAAASEAAEEAYHRQPWSVDVAIVNAMVMFAAVESGDTTHLADLNKKIDEIQSRDPGEEESSRMRVSLLAQSGKTAEAGDALKAMLAHKPPPSQNTLLALAEISRKWNLGLDDACMAQVQQLYGRTPKALLTEAVTDWKRSKDDTGLKLLENAVAQSSASQRPAFRLAMVSYLELTDDASAAKAWAALGDQYPDDLMVQRAALQSASAYTDHDFYDHTIDRVKKLLGDDSATWKIARARWLLDNREDAQSTADASALLKDVLGREPDSLTANILLGMAKARAGDFDGATAQVAAAQRLDPKSTMMAMDMARLLQLRGDYTGARQQLDLIIADPKSTPAQLVQAAGVLSAQGDVAGAIKILEPLAADSKAQRSYKLQLASLYCRARMYDQAQAIAADLEKTPDMGSVLLSANLDMLTAHRADVAKVLAELDTLSLPAGEAQRIKGNLYYSYGDFVPALALYKEACKAAPRVRANWMALMLCQVAMGRAADLPATITQAAASLPADPRIKDLEAVSILLAATPNGQTQQQILSAVIVDPQATSPAVTTLKALADMTASTAPAAETLQKMQRLAGNLPHFLPAQILLIETELRLGRSTDAIQAANRAVQNFPLEVRPCELLTTAYCTYGQWSDALDAARAWKSRMIGDPAAVDLQIAQIQMRMSNPAAAQETLAPYLQRTDLSPAFKWEVLLTDAQSLIVQGKPDEAVQVMWPTAQATPDDQPTFMGFLANNVTAERAEPWLTQLGAALAGQPNSRDMRIALATTWNQLYLRSKDEKYNQLAKDLVAKLEQDPASAAKAALAAGIFADTSGDYSTAEAAYRRSISHGELPETDNNLAMLLADHGGDIKEAAALANKCVTLAPNQATFRDTLAYIQARNKHFDAAIDAEQTAVQLEPNNAKWRVNLAKILVSAGKFEQARQQVAELDLMTPGIRALSREYKSDLDGVRKQIALNGGGASAH